MTTAHSEEYIVGMTLAQFSEYVAKLALGEDGFGGVAFAMRMKETLAFGSMQAHAKTCTLTIESLVGFTHQLNELFALTLHGMTLPIERLRSTP